MNLLSCVDKVPRLSISIVIWILSSDTICELNLFNTNSEAAMLSKPVGMSDVSTSDKANIRTKLLNLISFEYLWGESLSSLPSDKAQCQNQNVQSYIIDYRYLYISGDPLNSLPAPPPPLRETIFSTEIRSVEYEKSEEQKETVLFDDIGE